jgi:cystathionine beta-lyase
MKYNFDKIINRENTNCIKYDLRKKLFKKDDVIPMWVADMDFETPSFIKDAILQRAEHQIYGYSFRPDSFYDSIVNWVKTYHNWEINLKQISFSPGVVPGIAISVLAFTKPGDKIIVQPPVYFPFFTTIKENGRQVVENKLINKDGCYSMDFDDLLSQIDLRTKMIIISNPHNPVGRVWKKQELEKLVEICEKNEVLIISDEIHSDIVFSQNKHIPIATISEYARENTITFMAPSKTFNLAGLSTSVAIFGNKKLQKTYNLYLENLHLNLGNVFGNIASEAAYTNGYEWVVEMKNYILENINFAHKFISEEIPQINFIKPEATYLLWIDFSKLNMTDNDLNDFLINKAGIALNLGNTFGSGGEKYMRMNVACTKEVLTKALNQLKTAINYL